MSAGRESGQPQQYNSSLSTSRPESVFISYSLEDARFLKMLMRHLKVLENQGLIRVFVREALPPGALWLEITQSEISSAAVAILLVTPAYLESRALMKDQLPLLLDRAKEAGTTIMPLLVIPSLFYSLPHLCQFKPFNPTSKTLIEMRAGEREKFLVSVAEAVQEEVRRRHAGDDDIHL
jgi:internalin A